MASFAQWRRSRPNADRLISGILAAVWLWTGVVYQAMYFATIDNAAYLFAAMFVMQVAYMIYSGVLHHQVQFRFRAGLPAWTGAALIAYAAVFYPLIGIMTGHAYPEMPVFGVTPCPVTIFTFGVLVLTTDAITALGARGSSYRPETDAPENLGRPLLHSLAWVMPSRVPGHRTCRVRA